MTKNHNLLTRLAFAIVPALAFLGAIYIAASTWKSVRTRPEKRTLRVTGSASQRIISDLIEWEAEIETRDADRTASYRALRAHVDTTLEYLKKQGIAADDIRASSVGSQELIETEYVGSGDERIERQVAKGWSTRQTISVRSTDIAKVELVSREVTQLLESGVPISSNTPRYHYTKLGEVKIDMLARASEDARTRAQKIVTAAGGAGLGKLWAADMGVININPANSTATSWEGNNDKTSYEKDIITIVHLTFELP